MLRFVPPVIIICALLLGIFIAVFPNNSTVSVSGPSTAATATSSSVRVLPSLTSPTVAPTPSHRGTPVAEQQPAPELSAPQPRPIAPLPSTATPSSTRSSPEFPATALRSALVNIICYAPANGVLRSISGSGVLIDQKGVILTNAHVAQYFLLANQGVSCTIRMGSPAVDRYKASLMYISSAWLRANTSVLTEASPSGTGEYDFAFLAVTSSATSAKLPGSFPYVSLATESSPIGTPVTVASYGAQSLDFNQIQSALFPTVVLDSVRDVFTFTSSSVDAFALSGSAAAQEGSSGGGVVDNQGRLIGVLTTSTVSGDTNTRILHAITAAYIRSEYANETGEALNFLLAQSPAIVAADLVPQIPALESILTVHLP